MRSWSRIKRGNDLPSNKSRSLPSHHRNSIGPIARYASCRTGFHEEVKNVEQDPSH